ncbi:MAG: hypothetical protein R2729_04990 [Bryobacteraceae bacterium]
MHSPWKALGAIGLAPAITLGLVLAPAIAEAQDTVARARQLEAQGNYAGARQLLEDGARQNPPVEANLIAFAEFLDRYRDPDARAAYERVAAGNLAPERKRAVLHRLVILDLLAGDRDAAAKRLAAYRSAGGSALPESAPQPPPPTALPVAYIPGPITGFNRMAALAPDLKSVDILPALARNVVTNGYQASNSQEALEQTEYLKLVFRYLSQARELDRFAGDSKTLVLDTCDSPKTGELLKILGYRMRGQCGGDVVLETVNAGRAFLTIDSGFPLAEMELALRTNRPFSYPYKPTEIPVLYGPEYWMSAEKEKKDKPEFIDVFLSDPALCRLYLGLSKLDASTAAELRKAIPVQRLRAFAHVLDFFGGMFRIRDGKVDVPGGPSAEAIWAELAGAQPNQGAAFIEKLLAKDDGWLNSYFDSLSRIEGPVLQYLTQADRMRRFYTAIRGRVTSPGPARPVFRSNTDLMLLTTRLRMESDGRPHIPGGIEVWRDFFVKHPHGKYDGKLTRLASGWKEPDDLLEALFALCRKAVENEPLKIFMAMTDLNYRRAKPLEPSTVDRLARAWRIAGSQYPVFSEVPTLGDATIVSYLETIESLSGIRNQQNRADAAGSFQALVGLWQIFARNGNIRGEDAESALADIIKGFAAVKAPAEVFTASVAGANRLLAAANTPAGASPHDRMLALLAGTTTPKDVDAHQQLLQDMVRIFEAQKLISLKTILDLAAQIDEQAKGGKFEPTIANRLTARMQEIQLPRASLTGIEKNALSFGYWTEKHIEAERKVRIRAMLEKAGADAGKLNDARAELTPILRDTLVGFNYLYYAPPGAQLLQTNPLFVRSHDFLGVQGANQTWRTTEVLGSGWPSSAGGRLVGSLAGLPYALAEAEQNFLIPSREQALIWGDLVPQMMLSAKIPRFWNVSPLQIHWVGLHLRQGEALVAESHMNPQLRAALVEQLGRLAAPARTSRVDEFILQGDLRNALENITASELYLLGSWKAPGAGDNPLVREIASLSARSPASLQPAAISRAFGTPKPTLTNSLRPELLNLRTFPTLMGYSSRLMAESWEAHILYYVGLADELHLSPDRLNVAIPEWTRQTVERIFATHLEDWPALLRSLRNVGQEARLSARGASAAEKTAGE